MDPRILNSTANNQHLIRDPKYAKNRVFIGNLPDCTREQLESICLPYGRIMASMVQKNFGFVQFETEEIANKVASSLSKSLFKGNVITVRNANLKPTTLKKPINCVSPVPQVMSPEASTISQQTFNSNDSIERNDCEIIVLDRKNTKYAEFIENRLKAFNIRVDILFPNGDVPMGKVLANISARKCLYAVLVSPQNEEHRSITVNILYGQPAEHRNMPIENAIPLIVKNFQSRKLGMFQESQTIPKNITNTQQFVPVDNQLQHYRYLLSLLIKNDTLTVAQYNQIIKYLEGKRDQVIEFDFSNRAQSNPDPELCIQRQLSNVLKKPSVALMQHKLKYPTVEHVRNDYILMYMLKKKGIRKAINAVMHSRIATTVEILMKF